MHNRPNHQDCQPRPRKYPIRFDRCAVAREVRDRLQQTQRCHPTTDTTTKPPKRKINAALDLLEWFARRERRAFTLEEAVRCPAMPKTGKLASDAVELLCAIAAVDAHSELVGRRHEMVFTIRLQTYNAG